jgi:osmotically inducible protein OsmC
MPKRTASAAWEGSLTEGNGTMRMASGAYEGPYSFQSRFEEGDGTNPEELIAAAHAGCFSMALSAELGRAGHDPESVETDATVHLDKEGDGFAIKRIELRTRARVPDIVESIELDAQRAG